MKNLKLFTRFITLVTIWSLVIGTGWILPRDAMARQVHGHTRTNVNHNKNINRTKNVNRNTNVNVNRNVHVHGGGYYHDHDDGIGVGGAIAIGVAGMAVGSMITAAALPPSCSTISVNGITYQQCGSTWYQPQYSGSQVNYIVVNPPR